MRKRICDNVEYEFIDGKWWFVIGDDWSKYFSGVIVPVDTVIEECITDENGYVLWSGIVYTGVRSQKVGYRVIDDKTRPQVRYSYGEQLYWRHTGISKTQNMETI
jgi:hypothetical protein